MGPDLVSVGAKLARILEKVARVQTPNSTDTYYFHHYSSSKASNLFFSPHFRRFATVGFFGKQASVLSHLHPRLNSQVAMATMDYEQENGRYDSM